MEMNEGHTFTSQPIEGDVEQVPNNAAEKMFESMVNGGVDIGSDLTCVVSKCTLLVYLHFGVPPPPSLFEAVSKLEGGHRDGVALWLPIPSAVSLLNESGGEEVKKHLWNSCRASSSTKMGSFLANVSSKYYKTWPSLGLKWSEVKSVLPDALGNKAVDGEVARALVEGGGTDEEGLVAKLGELRHHHNSL
ncbi:hypothetical protein TrRE_jg3781, partial [Triparma retinervis]